MQGPTFVESVRLRYFDQLITSQPRVENNIWTVNIDEATINKYGQFPFKRDKYAIFQIAIIDIHLITDYDIK
jgi:CHASE2 domain-containing sensor protein